MKKDEIVRELNSIFINKIVDIKENKDNVWCVYFSDESELLFSQHIDILLNQMVNLMSLLKKGMEASQ